MEGAERIPFITIMLFFFLLCVQVSYSQTLGVIGYCLLPIVITAPIVSVLQSLPWASFVVKVINLLLCLCFSETSEQQPNFGIVTFFT